MKLQYATRQTENMLLLVFDNQTIKLRHVGGEYKDTDKEPKNVNRTQQILDAMNSINEALARD